MCAGVSAVGFILAGITDSTIVTAACAVALIVVYMVISKAKGIKVENLSIADIARLEEEEAANQRVEKADVTKEDLQILNFDYGLTDLSRFTIENCIKNRNSFGGTSASDVKRQIENAREFLKEEQIWPVYGAEDLQKKWMIL